jgi:hypothetical protein
MRIQRINIPKTMKSGLVLALFGLLSFCGCDFSEKVVGDSEEKNSYLFTEKLSEMQFTLFKDSVIKCYLVHAAFYNPMGGGLWAL